MFWRRNPKTAPAKLIPAPQHILSEEEELKDLLGAMSVGGSTVSYGAGQVAVAQALLKLLERH